MGQRNLCWSESAVDRGEPVTIRELPIACSLPGERRTTREGEWRELLEGRLIERRPISGGVALRLQADSKAVAELTRLIDLERHCCSWIDWKVTEGDSVLVEATSSEQEGARLLAQWFGPSG
jgi:hypothetical protein